MKASGRYFCLYKAGHREFLKILFEMPFSSYSMCLCVSAFGFSNLTQLPAFFLSKKILTLQPEIKRQTDGTEGTLYGQDIQADF